MKNSILLIFLFFIILNTLGQTTPPKISGSSNALCDNTPITLNATGCDGTINWNNGLTGQSISITQSGTYSANCTANGVVSPYSQPFIISSILSGVLSFSGQDNCSNSTFELNVIGLPAGTYPQFYRNSIAESVVQTLKFTPSIGGSYSFTAFDKIVGNWNIQNANSTLKINDIFFINANKGWAVGAGGRIYYTVNGGQNWSSAYVTSSIELKNIFFLNEITGWCVGTSGKVFKTTNGGISWISVSVSGLASTDVVNAVHFTDVNSGWITVNNKSYKTTNGGSSWIQESIVSSNNLTDVFFLNNSMGWILEQSSKVYKSENGGTTWTSFSILTFSDYLNDIQFIDANNGYIVGKNGFLSISNDGGSTWKMQNTNTLANLTKVRFINNLEGWVVGESGTILHTDDGGKSWNKQVLNLSRSFYGLAVIDEYNGWLAGENGEVRRFTSTKKSYCPTNSVFIKQSPERPNISKISCDNASVSLTVTNCEGTVSWSNGLSSQLIQVSQSGTYSAKCFLNGCESIESKKENLSFNSNLSLSTNTTCLSSNPILTVSGLDVITKLEWRQNQEYFVNPENTFAPTFAGNYDVVSYTEGDRKWELKENDILNSSLFAATMVDKNIAFAVGKFGSMINTSDGGKTWEQRQFDYNFYDIQFVDKYTGFIITHKDSRPFVFKTTDTGKTWQIIDVNFPYQCFEGIFFVNSQTGWIAGSGKSILKTTDGGLTWFVQSMDFGSGINFNSLFFINDQKGWVVGNNGKVFITYDGGNSWSERSANTYYSLRAVSFVNPHKGFAVGEGGNVFSSVDGGNTWVLNTDIATRYSTVFTRIQFIDELHGYIFASSLILYTNDGGITWGKKYSFVGGAHKMGAYFLDKQHGIIAGGGGSVAVTHDGTQSWIEKNVDVLDFKKITFIDKFNGWALSDKSFAKTVNGGKTWTYHSLNTGQTINRLFFLNKNVGWITTSTKIFKTIDGGITWNEIVVNINVGTSFFSGIFFFDENNGWVVGTYDLVLKTTNGGQSWTKVEITSYDFVIRTFRDIYFINQNKGWITGPNGLIYVTSNGGQNWQSQQSNTSYDIEKSFFINSNVGWLCARSDFLRTEDGGQTWFKTNFGIKIFSSVHFIDTQNGWGLIDGILHFSNDAGQTWQAIKSISENTDLYVVDEKEIFVVSSNKQILTYGVEKKYSCPTNSIIINAVPPPPQINSFSTILCFGKELKISSQNCNADVIWNNGYLGQELAVSTAGTYSAKCVEEGCESSNSNLIVMETSNNCLPIDVVPSVIYACPNESITLSIIGCPNNDVIWSNNMTGASINVQINASSVIDGYCRTGGNVSVPITLATQNLLIDNNIQNGVHQLRAIDTLRGINKIQSLEVIPKNTQVNYLSGKSIILEPGFEVKPNATFIAQIRSCE